MEKTSTGIGIGTVIAIIVSWTTNHSIIWAVIHGLLGWFYLIYRLLGFGG
jgi:hypothetical protein